MKNNKKRQKIWRIFVLMVVICLFVSFISMILGTSTFSPFGLNFLDITTIFMIVGGVFVVIACTLGVIFLKLKRKQEALIKNKNNNVGHGEDEK